MELELKMTNFKKERGFSKFNNQLLSNPEYISNVKKIILDLKQRYAAAPYDREAIKEIKDTDIQLNISDQMFFELLLLEIRGMSIPFASRNKKEMAEKEESLIRQIEFFQDMLDENHSTLVSELLSETNKELEELRKVKLKGIILRSYINWIENGEKPTKYFCALEKRSYVNKTVSKIINNKGENIVKQNKK